METQRNTGGINEARSNFRSFESDQKNMVCLPPDATLIEATRLMRRNHVGDVIVVEKLDGKSIPVGIITDRDIALEAEAEDLEECTLSDLMSKALATARAGDDVLEMIRVMKVHGVTRLPLVREDGSLAGIVTAKRLFQVLVQGLSDLTQISARQQQNEKRNHQ